MRERERSYNELCNRSLSLECFYTVSELPSNSFELKISLSFHKLLSSLLCQLSMAERREDFSTFELLQILKAWDSLAKTKLN